MINYMLQCGIEVQVGCNKEWGQPYPCDVCPPLFPTIVTAGVRGRSMPDGRVTTIIKGMMVALAAVRPDVVSVEQAGRRRSMEKFSRFRAHGRDGDGNDF